MPVQDLLKGGWHPGKDKSSSSSSSGGSRWIPSTPDFKGKDKINGYLGRGERSDPKGTERGLNHTSTPLHALKDPASFAPPPKHAAWYGPQPGQHALPAPAAQQAIEYAPQDGYQQEYQQEQYQQQQYQQPQQQYHHQPPQQYQQQPPTQALARPTPSLPTRQPQVAYPHLQQQQEEPAPKLPLGAERKDKPKPPSYENGIPHPLPPRNPAGIQIKPWQPGQKREKPTDFHAKPVEKTLTATERYMQRTRNYNKGGEGASWGTPGTATPPAAPIPARQQQQQETVQYQSAEEVMEEARDEAYHMDTTGLSTTNFAPPPKLFNGPASTTTNTNASAHASPAPPARTGGYNKPTTTFAPPPSGIPGASTTSRAVPAPPPRLPARQNSNPNEYTPAPPPSYTPVEEPEMPRAGLGGGPAAQVNELQARFARMNPGGGGGRGDGGGSDAAAHAAQKKKPPPPPVKKVGLAAAAAAGGGQGQAGAPPPVPLGSRPKF